MFNRKATVQKRHRRLRKKLSGTSDRPRLAVYRSSKHISAQVIDDVLGKTLVSASTYEKAFTEQKKTGANIEAAEVVGSQLAKRAVEKGITTVIFDRGGNVYHGRVKALADAARGAGLEF